VIRRVLVAWLAVIPLARADPPADFGEPLVPPLEPLTEIQERPETPPGEPDPETVLVLSASRVPAPLEDAPAIVSVITRDEIAELGARTLYEALRLVPELDVTRDAFGFYHVAIRGRKVDPEVLVLVDGTRINDFYDGRIMYDLPVSLVQRIEVLRGPGSALYGTNAFAGVISVYTRRSGESVGWVGYGTGGGDRAMLASPGLYGGVYSSATVARRQLSITAEGGADHGPELRVLEDSLSRNRFDPDTGEPQSLTCNADPTACPTTAYSRAPNQIAHLSLRLDGPGGLVRGDRVSAVAHGIYQQRGPLIGEFDTFTPDSRLATERGFGTIGYEVALRPKALLTVASTLDAGHVDRDVQVTPDGYKELVMGAGELFPEGQRKSVTYDQLVLRQHARVRLQLHPNHSLVVGGDVEHLRLRSYALLTNYDSAGRFFPELGNHQNLDLTQAGRTRTVLGAFVEHVAQLAPGLRFIAGGRADVYSDFGSALSPRAGLTWRRRALGLKAFYGWAFRAPTFEELYDRSNLRDLGGYLGNADLDPSRIKTAELGGTYRVSRGDMLGTLAVTGFYSGIADSIDRAPIAGLSNPLLNSSDVTSFGGSLELALDVRQRYAAFANASWFSAMSHYRYANPEEGLEFASDNALRSVPQFRANAGARARWRDTAIGGDLQVGGRRRNNERTPLESQHFFDYPTYALVDAYVRIENIYRQIYVRLQASNLTNAAVVDEPFRANRMPQGIPRDRLQMMLIVGGELR